MMSICRIPSSKKNIQNKTKKQLIINLINGKITWLRFGLLIFVDVLVVSDFTCNYILYMKMLGIAVVVMRALIA